MPGAGTMTRRTFIRSGRAAAQAVGRSRREGAC
jgi:hypothetical protein